LSRNFEGIKAFLNNFFDANSIRMASESELSSNDEISDSSSSISTENESENEEPQVKRCRTFRERINFGVNDFESRFRLPPALVREILTEISPFIAHPTCRNYALSPEQQLLLTLRFLATGGMYRLVGDAHGPSKPTVSRTVSRVVGAIIDHYFDTIVCWPTGGQLNLISRKFFNMGGMPSVAGCIDGTHVKIQRPNESPEQFVNRHDDFSINCMMVAGPNYQFYYCSARWPGSVHNSRVLKNS
jgi:hypothetical protein